MNYKIKSLLAILLFFGISFISLGEDPPPPNPPPSPIVGNDPVVGSPIEDGVPIILGLALFYGAYKLNQARKKLKESKKEV